MRSQEVISCHLEGPKLICSLNYALIQSFSILSALALKKSSTEYKKMIEDFKNK